MIHPSNKRVVCLHVTPTPPHLCSPPPHTHMHARVPPMSRTLTRLCSTLAFSSVRSMVARSFRQSSPVMVSRSLSNVGDGHEWVG